VKGTESADAAWQHLKVSSQDSWRLLDENQVPVYRVTDVFGPSPSVYIMLHGCDSPSRLNRDGHSSKSEQVGINRLSGHRHATVYANPSALAGLAPLAPPRAVAASSSLLRTRKRPRVEMVFELCEMVGSRLRDRLEAHPPRPRV
jgi:hypothetical protein